MIDTSVWDANIEAMDKMIADNKYEFYNMPKPCNRNNAIAYYTGYKMAIKHFEDRNNLIYNKESK